MSEASGYGNRANGTKKGTGYFGEIPMADGKHIMTEMGANATIDGEDVHYPLIHPNMTREEIDHLAAGKKPTSEMHDKAIEHAMQRKAAGKNPFAEEDDDMLPLPKSEREQMHDGFRSVDQQ